MALFDLPLNELRSYRPALTRRDDFESFWRETLAEAEQQPLNPGLEPVSYPVPEMKAFAAHYHGWQGARIAAWYLVPEGEGPFPPSTIFAVYNHLRAPKRIEVFPYHGHERPESHWQLQLHWANHFLRGVGDRPEMVE